MKQNLVGKVLGKIKIFLQDFVPIRTALKGDEQNRFFVIGNMRMNCTHYEEVYFQEKYRVFSVFL